MFDPPPQINMHDIELMLVGFEIFLETVILHFKYDNLVQNGRFSRKNNFKTIKFASSDLLIELSSFFKIKFRLVIFQNHFLLISLF